MNNRFLIYVILLVFNAMLLSSLRAQNADAAATAAKVPSAPNADKLYVLAFNDVVQMKVYQEEDLTTQVRIGKDGSVTLPLLGTVVVGGKTIKFAPDSLVFKEAPSTLLGPDNKPISHF